MRFLIRTDASADIGTGHVMRCLTLARALTRQGGSVSFVSRRARGDLHERIVAEGYPLYVLPTTDHPPLPPGEGAYPALAEGEDSICTAGLADKLGADWLVVDHYGLGQAWESRVRRSVDRLLVIDDVPVRGHDCDLLLDPNWSAAGAARWVGFVPADCRLLSGPRFALLRDEFFVQRQRLRTRDGRVRRILVSFGGADRAGAAVLACAALAALAREGRLDGVVVDVVAGPADPHCEALRAAVARLPAGEVTVAADNMAERMAKADLALGAGGSTIWERSYLGLPALVVVQADNQVGATEAVARYGGHVNLGPLEGLDAAFFAQRIAGALADPAALCAMGERGMALMGEPEFVRRPLEMLRDAIE